MKEIYTNNEKILLFLNKAQNKIAELSSIIVERGGDDNDNLLLLLELSDFIENLDSKYCTWIEEDIIKWISEYNYRANLNAIPYIEITGFNTIVMVGGSGINLPITTNDISDYIIATNRLIRATNHNLLANIQGGLTDERYHVTKQMYDYLDNLLNPKQPSTVTLQLTTNGVVWPSSYYELGTSISNSVLTGAIQYNYYKQASYFEYTRNGVTIGTRNSNPKKNEQPSTATDTTIIKTNTTFYFNAMFPDGLKSDNKNIIFKQPMYYGVIPKNTQAANLPNILINGTKNVRDRGEIIVDYNVPIGNTLINDDSYMIPYLFIPFEWGKFGTAFNSIFDFAADWTSSKVTMKLADNTVKDGLLLLYPTQVEGIVTFKFNW